MNHARILEAVPVTLDQNVELEVELPTAISALHVQARTAIDVRLAFRSGDTGTPARYWTIKSGTVFPPSGPPVPLTSLQGRKLYLFTSNAGGGTVEIVTYK